MWDASVEGVDAFWAGWCHEGAAAELVRSLKYGRMTGHVTPIADRMASEIGAGCNADLVTWVPCSPSRRADRGFDQGELLARAVARRLGLRARRLLRRLDNQPQTARSREGRLAGPRLIVRRGGALGSVLVIDDVCTTGSTLRAAAVALLGAGASGVTAAVATVAPVAGAVDGAASAADAAVALGASVAGAVAVQVGEVAPTSDEMSDTPPTQTAEVSRQPITAPLR